MNHILSTIERENTFHKNYYNIYYCKKDKRTKTLQPFIGFFYLVLFSLNKGKKNLVHNNNGQN